MNGDSGPSPCDLSPPTRLLLLHEGPLAETLTPRRPILLRRDRPSLLYLGAVYDILPNTRRRQTLG